MTSSVFVLWNILKKNFVSIFNIKSFILIFCAGKTIVAEILLELYNNLIAHNENKKFTFFLKC